MIKNTNKKINFLITISLVIFVLLCFSRNSLASTEVYFQKDVKEIKKGDTFYVNLKISSDVTINVIDGTITYDKDILKVKKVEIENSSLSIWVKEPTFDNKVGEISFVGGFTQGFKGKEGEILKIIYKAKRDGTSLIGFKDIFSVFRNDGLGTQINPWLKPMPITVLKKVNYIEYILIFLFVLVILFTIIKLLKKFRKNGK